LIIISAASVFSVPPYYFTLKESNTIFRFSTLSRALDILVRR
jgi:hypothetical protein